MSIYQITPFLYGIPKNEPQPSFYFMYGHHFLIEEFRQHCDVGNFKAAIGILPGWTWHMNQLQKPNIRPTFKYPDEMAQGPALNPATNFADQASTLDCTFGFVFRLTPELKTLMEKNPESYGVPMALDILCYIEENGVKRTTVVKAIVHWDPYFTADTLNGNILDGALGEVEKHKWRQGLYFLYRLGIPRVWLNAIQRRLAGELVNPEPLFWSETGNPIEPLWEEDIIQRVRREQEHQEQARREQAHREQVRKVQAHREQVRNEQAHREQIRREQARREQVRREHVRREQVHREQVRPEQVRKEQVQQEQVHQKQVHQEQARRQQAHREQVRPEQVRPEQVRPEQVHQEQARREQVHQEEARRNQGQSQSFDDAERSRSAVPRSHCQMVQPTYEQSLNQSARSSSIIQSIHDQTVRSTPVLSSPKLPTQTSVSLPSQPSHLMLSQHIPATPPMTSSPRPMIAAPDAQRIQGIKARQEQNRNAHIQRGGRSELSFKHESPGSSVQRAQSQAVRHGTPTPRIQGRIVSSRPVAETNPSTQNTAEVTSKRKADGEVENAMDPKRVRREEPHPNVEANQAIQNIPGPLGRLPLAADKAGMTISQFIGTLAQKAGKAVDHCVGQLAQKTRIPLPQFIRLVKQRDQATLAVLQGRIELDAQKVGLTLSQYIQNVKENAQKEGKVINPVFAAAAQHAITKSE